MKKRPVICGVVAAVVLCCALAGCIESSMKTLQGNSFSENRFHSIVFGRIRLVSKDGSLGSLFTDYACTNVLMKGDDGARMGSVKASLKPWQSSYAYQIEKPFYGEAVPGLYDLRTVTLADSCDNGNFKLVAGFAEFNSSFDNSRFVYSVPPGGLIYLGTLEVEVLNTAFESSGAFRDFITGREKIGTYNT